MLKQNHCKPTCIIPATISTQSPKLYNHAHSNQTLNAERNATNHHAAAFHNFGLHSDPIKRRRWNATVEWRFQRANHMLKKAAAEEVVPSNRKTGLIPSDDFAFMMRKCCGRYEMMRPQQRPKVKKSLNQSCCWNICVISSAWTRYRAYLQGYSSPTSWFLSSLSAWQALWQASDNW